MYLGRSYRQRAACSIRDSSLFATARWGIRRVKFASILQLPRYQKINLLACFTYDVKVLCDEEAAFYVLAGYVVAASWEYWVSTVGARHHGPRVNDNRGTRGISGINGSDIVRIRAGFWIESVVVCTRPVAREEDQRKRITSGEDFPARTSYCGWLAVRITFTVPYSDESSQLLCAKDFSLKERRGRG